MTNEKTTDSAASVLSAGLELMRTPKWLNEVNPMSSMMYRDVMAMFGYKSNTALGEAIKRGDFPQADRATAGPRHHQRVWFIKTIKREIHRRNQMSSNV